MIERIEINLLPAEYRVRKKTIKIPRAAIYPALLLLVLVVLMALYTIYLRDQEAELNQSIETITKEIQANRHIQQEINTIRSEMQTTEQKIRALERITVDREKWVRLLEILSNSLPSYTWLVSVREEAGPPERLNIEARTYSFPEVAHYMTRLEESDYIKEVALTGIEQIQGADRMMYRFNIICALDGEIGLSALSAANGEAAADTTGAPAAGAAPQGRTPRGGR
ncbi:MAG: PilN domain-containing protein [Chitinispirillales bacterium]|jgi:Tfp pilus assembly protein PilN|nr:PilN domain-containing protein [Chitinispirillales bacterium]